MLKGFQIIRLGLLITAFSLVITPTIGFSPEFTSFVMGMGYSLSLVGAGKRFIEIRNRK